MSRILPDREIKRLFGTVIIGAEEKLLNPNGIELRLGEHIKFMSTGEEKRIPEGGFVKVTPGESVIISSHETLNFRPATLEEFFPRCGLMALITPTTTMMREGISQSTTKIDAGYKGQLNWGLRNSSYKDLVIGRGESIFKLTFWLLEGEEVPEVSYGDRAEDKYQDTQGIKASTRRIPADIPRARLVSSSIDKVDPKKALREAGYPFDHIGRELIELDGKFEMVSTDVKLLTGKIEAETKSVLDKFDDLKAWLVDHVEVQLTRKFTMFVGTVVGAISIIFGVQRFLQGADVSAGFTVSLFSAGGAAILLLSWLFTRPSK